MQPLLDMMLETIPGPGGRRRRPAADARHHARLVRLRRPHRHRADLVGHDPPRASRWPLDAGRRHGRARPRSVEVHLFDKLGRVEVEEATAGDIAAVVGLEDVDDRRHDLRPGRPAGRCRGSTVDEPTMQMVFGINTSPLAGRDGKYVTTRHLRDRLDKELERNVALRVEPIAGTDAVRRLRPRRAAPLRADRDDAPRGLRAVGRQAAGDPARQRRRARRAVRDASWSRCPHDKLGPGDGTGRRPPRPAGRDDQPRRLHPRRLLDPRPRPDRPAHPPAQRHAGHGDHPPPLRELRGRWRATSPAGPTACWSRWSPGKAVAFGLDGLQERAEMFVAPGDVVYEGMIVGENSRTDDMTVNPDQGKEAHQHAGRRQRPQHPAEAAPADLARRGPGIHRGRRAGRGHARP